MNAARRKELKRALEMLDAAKTILEQVAEEEQDAYDNLPESIQDSERGEQIYDNADTLSGYMDDLDDMMSAIEEM